MNSLIIARAVGALLLLAPVAACSSGEPATEASEPAEAAKGPHNGRLLKDGDFAVEM